ncbi:MAG: hypothetical protein WA947_10895, partial [Phormidesmis sp.]
VELAAVAHLLQRYMLADEAISAVLLVEGSFRKARSALIDAIACSGREPKPMFKWMKPLG